MSIVSLFGLPLLPDLCAVSWACVGCVVGAVSAALNPQAPGEGEISLPHSRAIFSRLKNEDKDLF